MSQASRKSLDSLTGLRIIAAFWVVCFHFTVQFRYDWIPGKPPTSGQIPLNLAPILAQGAMAVDLFLLSGFILAYSYATAQGTLRGSKRAFWVARIARIYPVYLLGLALAFREYLSVEHNLLVVAVSVVAHALMIHSWIPATLPYWNTPSWSLGVEAFFYALFPLLLPLAGRLRRRGLVLLLIGSWVVFGVIIGIVHEMDIHGFKAVPGWDYMVRWNPLVSFPEFIIGMAVGLLFTRYGQDLLPMLRRFSGPMFDALIIGIVGVFIAILYIGPKLHINGGHVNTLGPFIVPELAAIILLLAYQRGMIAALLSRPVFVWLGEISYGVYILHMPVWFLARGVLADGECGVTGRDTSCGEQL